MGDCGFYLFYIVFIMNYFFFIDLSNSNLIFIYCSLFAAFSYGIASMTMVFINKAVLMQYAYSMTLLALQVLVSTYVVFELFFGKLIIDLIYFFAFFLAIGNNFAHILWSSNGLYKDKRFEPDNCEETSPAFHLLQCKCCICFSKLEGSQYSNVHCVEEIDPTCRLGGWLFFREGEATSSGM